MIIFLTLACDHVPIRGDLVLSVSVSPPGANNYAMIRILSVSFAERSLLKGFTGAVTDLAFAHIDSSLLGCVDEAGNLMVWQLTCVGDKIVYPDVVSAAARGRAPAELPPGGGRNRPQGLSPPTFLLTPPPEIRSWFTFDGRRKPS